MDVNKDHAAKQNNDLIGCLGGFIFISLFLIVLICGWRLAAHHHKFSPCIPLENGLSIGYNALFDLRGTFWRPFGTLKYPDGTVLIDQPYWSVYITKDAVYGHTFGVPNEEAFTFFWRADLGIIKAGDDYERYEELVAEAGPANENIGEGAYGAEIVLRKLLQLPKYADQSCKTKLFAW